jgi:hypothetical protein
VCYGIPDAPRSIVDGNNATVQLKYTSDFGTDKNQTFYACADITYVDSSRFTTQIPCFNVTSENFVPAPAAKSGAVSVRGLGLAFGVTSVAVLAMGLI